MAQRTPIKAIRAKCLDCCNYQPTEVRECKVEKCPLYEYRMGHRPKKVDLPIENILDEKS